MTARNIPIESDNFFNPIKILLKIMLFILSYGLIPVMTCGYLYTVDEFEEFRAYLLAFTLRFYLPILFVFWVMTKLFTSIKSL
jgi:hypothetical protein